MNDENCVSNAEKVKNYAMRFSEGYWTFLGPGSEEKRYGSSNHAQKGQWNCVAAKMVQRFKETGHPEFKSISALSRGILKQKTGKTSIHFNRDSMNTELLFQTIHSVNQLSVYGAVVNWCYQLGSTEEEKGTSQYSCGQQDFDQLKPEEVQLLVSPPTRATGNRMPERVQSFDELAGKLQLTQLCEKTYFHYLVAAGKQYKSSTKCGRRLGDNYSFVPRIRKPKLWQLFLKAPSLDQYWVFIL